MHDIRQLALTQLQVQRFRNLAGVALQPSPRFTVIFGANGQGKTNLLEAIYVLCRGKSFRAGKLGELVQQDQDSSLLGGSFLDDDLRRSQSVQIARGSRALRIDGKRPATLAAFAVASPVIVFHPGELTLTMGSASERRALLDRVAFFQRPAHLGVLEDYVKVVKERQRALEERGPAARDLPDWEQLLVRNGLQLMQAREQAARDLLEVAAPAFQAIAAPDLQLVCHYQPSAPWQAEAFAARLVQERVRDARRGSASTGPHRDDWEFFLDGRPVRGSASQGQHRALVLALKSAEIEVIARARGVRPLLLLDDVSSELDRDRTRALFAFLERQQGQVFLTTTRPELVDLGGASTARVDVEMRAGNLVS